MNSFLELLQDDVYLSKFVFALLILVIINIILIIFLYLKYIRFMKKIGKGNNLDEMLKQYLSDVKEIKKIIQK